MSRKRGEGRGESSRRYHPSNTQKNTRATIKTTIFVNIVDARGVVGVVILVVFAFGREVKHGSRQLQKS